MKNIVLTGIGGQGTVLAAKVLAQAAQSKGWHVRTAETIGMAQRGGSVVSHVRMGDEGERVVSPLVSRGQADVLISFEPGEGARMCGVLKPEGALVTASRVVQPVTASLSKAAYEANSVLRALVAREGSTVVVDERPILEEVGNAKCLNMILLASAVATGALDLSLDELKGAVRACVKPRFAEMNMRAIDVAYRNMH